MTRTFFAITMVGSLLASTVSSAAAPPDVGPQIRVDNTGSLSTNETTSSASDANPGHIVAGWNDYQPNGTIRSGFALSTDSGQTWSSFLLRPPGQNQSSVEGDPMTAFDPRTGTLWAGAISFSGGGGLYVARKGPNDANFGPSVMARRGSVDKCWMAAGAAPGDPNSTRLYIAYNEGIIWSDDMGQTWSSPRGLGGGIGFLPRIGPNGEIYVCYWDFGAGNILKRSLDGGATFTTHTIATRMDVWGTQDGSRFPGLFRVPSLITMDVDEHTGDLYATYFDTTNIEGGQRNVDIYFTKSVDQGTTWSTPVVINGDSTPPGDQCFPWVEVDDRGRIHVVFFDTRNTTQRDNDTNGWYDAYYTVSEDGGATWQEFRLTPDPWNSADDGILGGGQFLGDYLGLAVAGNSAFPIYIDTSNGRSELYTNVITFTGVAAQLNSLEVVTGTLLGGDVTDLAASDNAFVHARSGFGRTLIDAHLMAMVVHASTAETSPASLDVSVESHIDQPAGFLAVAVRNWSTNAFDVVGQFAIGPVDQTHTILDIDATDRVSGAGEVDVMIKHVVLVPFLAFTFESFVDRVEITIN